MLYDAYDRPVRTQELRREIAAPTLAGVRTIWNETVAAGLTPAQLAGVLRNAAEGDHHAFLTLAEEMEERDLHYACELGKRKLAVSRLPVTIEAASDEQRDIDLADEVRALVKGSGFRNMVKDMLDGLGKGFSVVEINWRRGARWIPAGYDWRDPRFFQFDLVTRREIRLRDEANLMDGIELPPYKFLTHVPRIKSGIPIRGGLARLAAWSWMCKSYTIKDWLAFAEVFGMPLRMGKYGPGATESEINILKMAVANLGSDAAAVFPDSMQVELVEAGKSQGAQEFFKVLADYLDSQVSKGILGQTASASGTPGRLGDDKLQSEVRDDIRDDDAEQLEETLNRDLVRPFIDLNHGPQDNYPELQIRATEPEDIKALSEALGILVPLGFRVEQSVIRDRLGLPDPDAKTKPEDLLGAPTPAAVPAPAAAVPVPDKQAVAANRESAHRLPLTAHQPCPHCLALNAEDAELDGPDVVIAEMALEFADDSSWTSQILALIEQAPGLPQAATALARAAIALDAVAAAIASAQVLGNLMGRSDVQDEIVGAGLAVNAETGGLPFDEAIAFFRQKTGITSETWTDLWQGEHSRAFTVAGVMRDDMLADFRAAIDSAIADGTTYQAFLADFDAIVERYGWSYKGNRGWRSRVIYETNIRTAYQAGRWAQLTDPDLLAVNPYLEYRHGDSVRPRQHHLAWDGIVLPASDPWWDTHFAPNGWGCKCKILSAGPRDLAKMGKTGPDTAPDLGTYEWVDKKSGEIHDVPVGIDPGWAYNPGKAWFNPATGKVEPR